MILAIAICILNGPLRLEAKWTAPGELPFERTHAIVVVERKHVDSIVSTYYVGGLRGLYRGMPGSWQRIDERPVKQVVHHNEAIWALFGDGSLDKIDYKTDRLVFDVMVGRAKRPWTSVIGADRSILFCGGLGGWVELGSTTKESHPKDLEKQVVTSVARWKGAVWLGTQRAGLFSIINGAIIRYGYASGLPDSWVTATTVVGNRLYAGCSDGAVSYLDGKAFKHLESPATKIRLLTSFQGKLVIGALDGAWIETNDGWQRLTDEETTCLAVVRERLLVGTPTSLLWWRHK